MSDPDRPAWFTGSEEALSILRRAASERGVVLDRTAPPDVEEAQELTGELADILISDGFDGAWEITAFGDMVENLIDALNRYAFPG